MRSSFTLHLCILIFSLSGHSLASAAEDYSFFEGKVRPVLIKHCYECHSSEYGQAKGGLLLDSRSGWQTGGDSGPAIVAGKAGESLLMEAVRYKSFEMPPKYKLPAEEIAHLEKWINSGAPDPREEKTKPIIARDKAEIDWEQAQQFWSFQPPHKSEDNFGDQHRIDGLVRKSLQEQDLTRNPPASDRALIRRLYFDLIGIPPTAQEAQAFYQAVQENRHQAIESVVDQLLNSPHFGEKWASLWLDVSRYAEDQAHIVGNNKSLFFPNAYLYRDWVIQAFNTDLPYDEFVRLQLAADLHSPDEVSDDVALGFIGLGPKYYRRSSPEVMADEWEDRVDVVSRGLLGLTVACARCHDHKFDPIPTEDYYSLAGVFASTEMWNRPLNEDVETQKSGHAKNPEESWHIIRDKDVGDINVHIRGDVNSKGEITPRRFLQVLARGENQPFQHGSGRLELAEAIVSPENPLAARVIVNRIWTAYFGSPLVGTLSNFGELGEMPTHPELLDDLAARFMENGWSLKWLHREIVTSNTYQQSSDLSAGTQSQDPANIYLARMNRRRLSVEQWRDAILAATGELASEIGGKSIIPDEPTATRRTVYSDRSRFQLNTMLALFDFPDPNAHAASRVETTTPLQKMFVMNSPFMLARAEAFAKRIAEKNQNLPEQIQQAYFTLYSRQPTAAELELGESFVAANGWPTYAQVFFASNEFLILD